ncbi:MAG: hypothetical protein II811_10230 [Spirochaetaceae bacterium]|nr:hypothetical protein [Spirochaetaceae bacterium]
MNYFKYNSTVAATNTVALAVVDLVEKQKSDDKTFNLFGTKIKELAQAQTVAIKKDRVYSGLDVLDAERDSLWKAAIDIIGAYKKNPVKEISDAAEKIFPIAEKYGKKITRVTYDEETAYLKSAQTDFSAEGAAAAIKVLPGLSETLENLWAKNADFEAQTASFVSTSANSEKSATSLRKELVSLINSFITYVDVVGVVRSDLLGFSKELQSRIDRANALA